MRSLPGIVGPFTLEQGRRAGLSGAELRDRRWARPFAGVRTFEEPETVEDLARAYAVKMGEDEFFSHITSAVLLGLWLPLPMRRTLMLDVAVPIGVRAPRDRRVRGHHLIERPGLVRTARGMRVASARETWCQLATVLGLVDLVIAGDSLLAKNRPDRLALHELVSAVQGGDRPRQGLLQRALPLLREGSRSAKETQLRLLLAKRGLPEPEVNGEVLDPSGARVAECDLVFRAQRVVVEYEGE